MNLVHHLPQILGIVLKIHLVRIDNQQFAIAVAGNPLLVALVQPLEIVETHAAFVVPAPRLDVSHERGNARPQVNQQVRRLNLRGHGLKKAEIILKIPGRHQAHVVQVGRKNVGVFVDGSVLNDRVVALQNIEHLLVAMVEKINLQVERPPLHVVVEVCEVGIVVSAFEVRLPVEMAGEFFTERSFACANVPGDGDVLNLAVVFCKIHQFDLVRRAVGFQGKFFQNFP